MPLALPLSFRHASPRLVALFLACVWTEANKAELSQHQAYSFGAGGERSAGETFMRPLHVPVLSSLPQPCSHPLLPPSPLAPCPSPQTSTT